MGSVFERGVSVREKGKCVCVREGGVRETNRQETGMKR